MASLGGKTIPDGFRKIMKYLFSNIILAQFSWRGTAEKKPFQPLDGIRKLVFDAVKSTHPTATVADYDTFVKNYVRYAKFRKVLTLLFFFNVSLGRFKYIFLFRFQGGDSEKPI